MTALDAMEAPHGLVVYAVLFVALAGTLLAVFAAFLPRPRWTTPAAAAFVLAALGSWGGLETGRDAKHALRTSDRASYERLADQLDAHAAWADRAVWALAAAAAVAVPAAVRGRRPGRIASAWRFAAATAAALAAVVLILTAIRGSNLATERAGNTAEALPPAPISGFGAAP